MKKISTVMTALLILFSIVPVSMAKSDKSYVNIIYQAPEIKNLNVLYDRALLGITDKNTLPKAKVIDDKGKEIEAKVVATTQLVKKQEFEDGTIEKEYVTTTFVVAKGLPFTSKAQKVFNKEKYMSFDYIYREKWIRIFLIKQ